MLNLKQLCTFAVLLLLLSACNKDYGPVASELDGVNMETVNLEMRVHENVCFMTYNTFLLDTPDLFGGPQCEGEECVARALSICEDIKANMPTVVHLQEVFVNEAGEALKACLEEAGYEVEFDDSNDPNWLGVGLGSGLLTASLLPMSGNRLVEFEESTGVLNSGNDGAADKGFMVNKIELEPGCFITSINTHADAGGDRESRCVRIQQFMQINDYIDGLPADEPVLLGGDLNIDANGGAPIEIDLDCLELFTDPRFDISLIENPEFDVLLNVMDGRPVHLVSGDQLDPTASDGQILDYFIISNMSDAVSNLTTETVDLCKTVFLVSVKIGPFGHSFRVDTEQEAQDIVDHINNNIEGLTASFQPVTSCESVSDHKPVVTCFDYDCEEQLENNVVGGGNNGGGDPDPNDGPPCRPICPPGEQCLNGRCVPL